MRFVSFALVLGLASLSSAAFVPLDLSSVYNLNRQGNYGVDPLLWQFPSGLQTYSGIPFQYGNSANADYWSAVTNVGPTNRPVSIDIPVYIIHAEKVHTILNTNWGTTLTGKGSIEFFGENGAYHKVDLQGDQNVRSIQRSIYTNGLSDPNASLVWSAEVDFFLGYRHDRQEFVLPTPFQSTKLTNIRVNDTGANGISRLALMAVTVQHNPVPEPLTSVGLLLGVATLARKKRN
jgi:hypothetical protein